MSLIKAILHASQALEGYILKTPLIYSHPLSDMTGGEIYLKLESEQYTGSFKARGSMNKLLSLGSLEREKGVVTASTGNHALGFARAASLTKTKGIIYLPRKASRSKVKKLSYYPVELRFVDGDSLTTEIMARDAARKQGLTWVSPYNDAEVMAGQGTVGKEICDQVDHLDAVFITVGGGGLIAGAGSFCREIHPDIRVFCCQPANSPEMSLSLRAGHITNLENAMQTLSDGSAGGIEDDSITFPICQDIIDECILIEEEEIEEAIRFMAEHHGKIVEGAAGVAVASVLKKGRQLQGKTAVVVICGGNIDFSDFRRIIHI